MAGGRGQRVRVLAVRSGAAVSAAIIVAAAWWWLGPAARGAASGFLRTADQQAMSMYQTGDAEGAASRFRDPAWIAAAWYRAGDFARAASTYAGLAGVEAAFNHGNALVMLGRYDEAVTRYDAALSGRPDWEAARINRDIAAHRAERVRREGGEGTGGKLGADEIRFEEGGSKNDTEQQQVVEGEDPGIDLDAGWLRRVQTDPGDFLRAKFAYQQAHPKGAQ